MKHFLYLTDKPKFTGYYVTKYFNIDLKDYRYKAFWWDGRKFGGWRLEIDDQVIYFYPGTLDQYYLPSMEKMKNEKV